MFAFFNQKFLLLGPPLPKPLAGHQMLSWDTNLVVLGGKSSQTSWSSLLYHLECNGGVFTWQTMKTKMTDTRSNFVAFRVPEEFVGKLWKHDCKFELETLDSFQFLSCISVTYFFVILTVPTGMQGWCLHLADNGDKNDKARSSFVAFQVPDEFIGQWMFVPFHVPDEFVGKLYFKDWQNVSH